MAREEPVIADEIPPDEPVERTLRQELESAAEEVNARQNTEVEEAPARAPRQERQERPSEAREPKQIYAQTGARDANGRLLPKEVSQPQSESPVEAPAPEVTPQASVETVAPEAPADPLIGAPSTWPAAAKEKFSALPAAVREVILKREQDIMRGFSQIDGERQFGRSMRQIVQPYEAILRASNTSPEAAVQSVLNTAYVLRTADSVTKARTLAQVAKDYGVDLNLLSPGVQPQPQPFESKVSGLQQRLDQQDARWEAWQAQQQQAAERSAADIYESFANNPANKYFAVPAVQTHMGALMQAGVCKTMEEAYKMACAAQPEVASRIAAENTAASKAAEAKRLAAEKARRKSVSVRGGPGGNSTPPPNMGASVRDDIMAAIEESNGRI